MNFLLEFSKDQFGQKNLPLNEVLSSGGRVLLSGILTVFGVLCLLWLTLVIFKLVFHDIPSKRGKRIKPLPSVNSPVADAAVNSDDELIAVIAAAIAMAESESPKGTKFRVVSFVRK